MNINYCLPIIKSKKEEVREIIQNNINDYRYFEVWIDYIEDLDDSFIERLILKLSNRLILLFRRQNLEPIKKSTQERQRILSLVKKTESVIDLDISEKESMNFIKNSQEKIKTIISYHNYHETPENGKLLEIVDTIRKNNPNVVKISTLCNENEDAVRLLDLLLKIKKEGEKCIVLGMGQFGAVTRIFGTFWGNEMIYAPLVESEESAPGQLTRSQLEAIFKNLKK